MYLLSEYIIVHQKQETSTKYRAHVHQRAKRNTLLFRSFSPEVHLATGNDNGSHIVGDINNRHKTKFCLNKLHVSDTFYKTRSNHKQFYTEMARARF